MEKAKRFRTRDLVMAALMAALMVVLAQITIPIGPIPFSMSIFAIYFAGAMLPPLAAAGSFSAYLLLGIAGLPVFVGMRGGLQVIAGPTGGYLLGYFAILLAVSLTVKHRGGYLAQLLAALGGTVVCYLLGSLWYMVVGGVDFMGAVAACVLPFALPDAIKAAAAVGLARLLRRRLAPREASA